MTHKETANSSGLSNEFPLDLLLGSHESSTLEFKRVGKVDNAIKSACAMANTEGGAIVFGVEDSKKATGRDRLLGVQENLEAFGNFLRDLHQRINPPLSEPACKPPSLTEVECVLRDGTLGSIGICQIAKSNMVHSLVDGGTYGRFGCQNRQLSAPEITELSFRRGVCCAVDATADVDVELLDTELWKEYASKRQLTRSCAEALRHLGLIKKDESGKWLPTVAAVLLFAEHPGGLLSQKCAIRIFHYQGHEIESGANTNLVKPPITIDGPLLFQIRAATKAISDELSQGVQVSVDGFEFSQKYPDRVVQEAICNAVIHRDYRLSNRDIHVRIFRNRIEIESPGVFPGAVTASNINEIGSHPRNRALVDHLREFPKPPNLDAGEGVRMIFASMEQKNLYPPIYKETDTAERQTVQVTLRNEARQPEWKLVHDALVKQKTLKNADVRQILNIENTVRTSKLLKAWVNAGLIEIANPEAGTRIREYRLASAEDTTTITNWLRDGGAAEVAGAIQQLISSYRSLDKNKNSKEPEEPELLPKS